MSSARLRRAFLGTLVPMLVAACATPARAQAWLPSQGEGVVSFVFQDQFFKYHMLPTVRVDAGHISSKAMLVDVTYGVTDKVAVSVGLPWIATKYVGRSPHPLADFSGPNPIDDGTWHTTAQDFRFDVRYNVTRNLWNTGIVLTPFVGSVVPSHDYPYFIHSGFGRGLNELQLGVSAAKLLDDLVPGLIVQGRYGYGFTERVADISHNRSFASLEVGYFATPKLRLMALSSAQLTHGGIDLSGGGLAVFLRTRPLEQFLHHDQIQHENQLTVGAGAAYSLTNSVDVFGSWMKTVAQRNGHLMDRGLTLGVSWSFSTRRPGVDAIANAEKSLVRCLCEKSGA